MVDSYLGNCSLEHKLIERLSVGVGGTQSDGHDRWLTRNLLKIELNL